jgi:glutaconate CoA-transferase, subunit A
MRSKLTTVAEAVATIPSGSTVAVGGSLLRRQPMALVREIVRQQVQDLQLLTWASSLATDMLVAAGSVRAWEGIYVGFWWYGLAPNFRRAVEQEQISVRDRSESFMTARFRAAAMGLPFLPVAAIRGIGSTEQADVATVTCPYTGRLLHAAEACRPDVTILHGYRGDEFGNVAWPAHRDSDDLDLVMAAGARRLIVTVEEIVPHDEIKRTPNLTYIPHVKVEAICEAPWGAYPSSCDTAYDEDAREVRRWLEVSRDTGALRRYLERFVASGLDHRALAEELAGSDRLADLTVTP